MKTFQDFESAADREAFIIDAIDEYTESGVYLKAVEAEKYYKGENSALLENKTEVSVGGAKIDLTAAIRSPSGIFKRLIVQLVQTIWAYGVQLDGPEIKGKLGRNFDKTAEGISKKAALHSVCYGFWNFDRLQRFTALEYFPLKDERSGQDLAGLRFWSISDEKPMYIQLFETDGWTEYKREKNAKTLETVTPKQAYKLSVRHDALSSEVVGGENYGVLPIIPMYANDEGISEFSKPIKSKIDLGDFILSSFCDSVMRTKAIYWVLNGFMGSADDLSGMLGEIQKLGIIAPEGDASAAAQTFDLPFGAVKFALEELEKGIYLDFMGMQLTEITGGSLTNVAIQTAQHNLNLKVSDFEWQAFKFVQSVLALQGIDTENIRFKKKSISNDMELMQMLIMCRADFDLRTALEKNPLVEPDEVEVILQRRAEEDLGIEDDDTAKNDDTAEYES